MSGLVLKLQPKERLLVNGAVIENGERRTKFSIVSSDANILRLKDAIHPDEANTPVKRACYTAQLVLSGNTSAQLVQDSLLCRIEELSQVFTDRDSRQCIAAASHALINGKYYQCLKALRSLIPREERLLAAGLP